MSQTQTPQTETHAFQAEISQLLDIVIHSIYKNREIFVRELISNAADALEKIRHLQLTEDKVLDKDAELGITINVDKDAKTFTIRDNGLGMTRDELVEHLGTIAHSGTRQFLEALKQNAPDDNASLIGQFGVGFYSAFMVADQVSVKTRSWHPEGETWEWKSDGKSGYEIAPADPMTRGTEITLHLREETLEFAEESRIKDVITRFSNFVPMPIKLGEKTVNTVQAIWTRSKSEVSEEEYKEFYRFVDHAPGDPRFWLHFTADVPLSIKALLYVPDDTFERMGLGKMTPGVDLYCRKVLIEKHPENLLPDWMRFVRGVIDSDDLPLNLSRETLQDNNLVRKISNVIVGRFIKFLVEKSEKDTEAYEQFYAVFSHFIKEGVTTDFGHRAELAKLLRFESSKTEPGKTTSLAEYVDRMKTDQKEIYFLNGSSRKAIENGPYFEAFAERDLEVLFTSEPIDDFVMSHLMSFEEKQIVSADRGDLELGDAPETQIEETPLDKEQAEALCGWLKETLGERVSSVRSSKRLVKQPVLVATDGQMTSAMHKLMEALQKSNPDAPGASMQWTMEVNPAHPLIKRLDALRESDAELAGMLAEQLCDNAMLSAGALTDSTAMVDRIGKIMLKVAK